MQTTAAPTKLATSAVIKTLLQLAMKTGVQAKIKEWGISFDGATAGTPGEVELIETDVAATVTAAVTNDITRVNAEALLLGDPLTALINAGVAATGYNATAEGAIAA
ncbi:MAG: hypothetical protein KGI08_11410, partial [Thaumarchaeota archaeon]|nr:hypothetical protein [Nitrososphaerota archaeon]